MKAILDSIRKPIHKIVKLGVVLMVLTSILGLLGCSDENAEKPKEVQMAEKMLREKYDEDFVTYAMGGRFGTMTNRTFTVTCSPKNDADLKFQAEIAKDGSYMYDEYVTRRVSALIEDAMSKHLKNTVKDFVIKVGAGIKTVDLKDSRISVEEFMKKEPNEVFAFYVVIDKEKLAGVSIKDLYDSLDSMFNGLPKLNGSIKLYLGNKDVLQKAASFVKENANVNATFQTMVQDSKEISIGITESSIDMSLQDFEAKFRGI